MKAKYPALHRAAQKQARINLAWAVFFLRVSDSTKTANKRIQETRRGSDGSLGKKE